MNHYIINFFRKKDKAINKPDEFSGASLENYLELISPDFLCVTNLQNLNKKGFSKNYNLKFDKEKEETLNEIIKSINPDQSDNFFAISKKIIDFIKSGEEILKDVVFQLRFTASLISGLQSSLLLNLAVQMNDSSLGIITVNDVTRIINNQQDMAFNIKWKKKVDLAIDKRITCLENEINNILVPDVRISKREHEILILIAEGKTSKLIAEELFISVKTVSTHRQNLLKKFEANNIYSLIRYI